MGVDAKRWLEKQCRNFPWEAHDPAGQAWVELVPNQGRVTKMWTFRAWAGSIVVEFHQSSWSGCFCGQSSSEDSEEPIRNFGINGENCVIERQGVAD